LAPGEEITSESLLNRTVLYKVGHHGSHNATLKGEGLEKMAQDQYAPEFVAMIPANSQWAYNNSSPWRHPLDSIRAALVRKAGGRVFQTDLEEPEKPTDVTEAEWGRFMENVNVNELYLQYTVLDEP
jgi:hypothetical protein